MHIYIYRRKTKKRSSPDIKFLSHNISSNIKFLFFLLTLDFSVAIENTFELYKYLFYHCSIIFEKKVTHLSFHDYNNYYFELNSQNS